MWSDRAKDVMRKAAIRADLITESDHPNRLMLVSEPEAAALYCERECKRYDLLNHERFMICDAGGGTVDLIVYEITISSEGRRLSEVTKGHGASCGSMFIDLNLKNLLIKKFGIQAAKLPKNIIPSLVETFAYQVKPQFDGIEDQHLALPRSDCFDDLDDPKAIGIDGMYICLKASELKEMVFEPAVKKVLTLIQEQLDSAKLCQAIFMVGGFGASNYLLKRVKQEFGGVVRTISAPHKPEMAVVCGAVYAGLNSKTVAARIARRCYGVGTSMPFEAGIDPVHLKVERIDGIWCKNRFSTFVRKGQKIDVDECVSDNFSVTKLAENETFSYSFNIYSIDGEPRRYVTDTGVSKQGGFSVPSPFKPSDPIGHKIDVDVNMYFGLIEIIAEGIIQGKKYYTTLQFN
ncbi:Heat shock 70 kDa protein 12A [Mortierella sp. AM989]|nr:Heat shock 70 kDa protein 12A [Mortierella sp. AM989]